jgi:hypothetical protein
MVIESSFRTAGMAKVSGVPSEEARMLRLWALVRSTTESHERVFARCPEDDRLGASLTRLRQLATQTYESGDALSAALHEALRAR